MKYVILAGLAAILLGCSTPTSVDMSDIKSPQAGAKVESHPASQKTIRPSFRIVKGGEGTGLILK